MPLIDTLFSYNGSYISSICFHSVLTMFASSTSPKARISKTIFTLTGLPKDVHLNKEN